MDETETLVEVLMSAAYRYADADIKLECAKSDLDNATQCCVEAGMASNGIAELRLQGFEARRRDA